MSYMFRLRSLSLAIIAAGSIAVAITLAPPAFAATCGEIETTIIDCASAQDTTGSPIVALLVVAIQILTGLIGIVAIGALIYAGILYSSASGNASQVAKAKEIITNTVIGLILFAGMALLLNYLIPGGLFTGNARFGAGGNGESSKFNQDTIAGSGSGSGSSNTTTGQTAVTVASWNSLFSNKTSIASGAKSIGGKAQVIGFQEVHWTDSKHRDALLKDFICSSCKFDGYMDPATRNNSGSKPSSLPIAWERSRFTRIGAGYKNVYLENDYAGGGAGSAKWITWVKLKDIKTGDQFYVLNTHTVASVESKGKPSGDNTRLRGYVRHMDTLSSLIKSFKKDNVPIVVLGDFNVNYRYDIKEKYRDFPYVRLGQIGLKSTWNQLNLAGISSSASTHGGGSRLIDYVWTWGPNVSVKSASIGSRYGSDHHAVYSSLTMGVSKTSSSTVAGSASTLSSLSKVENFRDLALLNSNLIRPGVIYRSAKLQSATASDKTKLASGLKNGAIIDLRTPTVRSRSPDPAISGVMNLNFPVDGVASASGYVTAFVNDADGREQFGLALTRIANTPGPVLIHCTAGKDRTGWLSSMLLYIAGANDQQVMTEYLQSNTAGADFKVDKSWLSAALSAARKKNDGSIMTYITSSSTGLGVSAATVAKIKEKISN